MAFLTVGAIDVPVAQGTPGTDFHEVGDRGRAFGGTMRSTVRARKREFPITTTPMTTTDAAALETALTATQPISFSGDLMGGSVDCHVSELKDEWRKLNGELRRILHFLLQEE
jgi:hypothetical protein